MEKYFHKTGQSLLVLFLILILGSAIIYAQDYQTYYKNGYDYFLQGKYEMAEEYYKKAIELNPDFENAHYWLGKVCKQTGDYAQAIEQWKEVLRINPGNQYAFQNLKGSFKSTSRVQSDKANDYLNEGIKIIGNPEEYFFRGDAPSVNSLLSAIPYFRRAAGIEPNLLEAYYWIGETYRVLGGKSTWQFWLQLEKAKSLPYKQVLERKGYFGFGYPSRIEVSFKDGDKIESWTYLEKDIIFTVINGEVEGEKEKEPEQSEIETKAVESIPEEEDD